MLCKPPTSRRPPNFEFPNVKSYLLLYLNKFHGVYPKAPSHTYEYKNKPNRKVACLHAFTSLTCVSITGISQQKKKRRKF